MKAGSRRHITVIFVLAMVAIALATAVILKGYRFGIPIYRGHFASHWRDSILREKEVKMSVAVPSLQEVYEENEHLMRDGDSAAVPVLLNLAQDDDPRVREFVAEALGRRKEVNERLTATLQELSRDADVHVRLSAKEGLARIRKGSNYEGVAGPTIIEPPLSLPIVLAKLRSHGAPVSSLSFSSTGGWLASADVDSNVVLWATEPESALVQRLSEFQHGGPTGVSFNPQNDHLCVFCKKFAAEFQPVSTGEEAGKKKPFKLVKDPSIETETRWTCRSIVFPRTGPTFAVGYTCGDVAFNGAFPDDTSPPDFIVRSRETFNVARSVEEFLRSNDLRTLAFSPDGQFLAVGGRCRKRDKEGFVLILEVNESVGSVYSAKGPIYFAETVDCLAYSSDGKVLAAGRGLPIYSDQKPRSNLVVLNSNTGKTVKEFFGCNGPVHALAFSPRANMLLVGGGDSDIHVFTGEDWHSAGMLQGHTEEVTALCFSHDGKTFASGGTDNLIILWNSE